MAEIDSVLNKLDWHDRGGKGREGKEGRGALLLFKRLYDDLTLPTDVVMDAIPEV